MRYFPIIDTRQSCEIASQEVKRSTKDQHDFVTKIEDADAILVGGGDGFMLSTMRNHCLEEKPFIGYNCGTLGFLMNQLDSIDELPQDISLTKIIKSDLINIEIKTLSGEVHHSYCINDLTIGASINDYFHMHVDSQNRSKEIIGTGMVLATSIGATGYALNLGAPLMPLESSLWCLVGIATHPFHYKYLKQEKITITASGKSPINVSCDGHAAVFENVEKVIITKSEKSVRLGFCPQQDFVSKRVMLAEEKLGGAC